MAYDFHYTPTGTGVISGKEVLEQTEDAINDLGNTAISGVQEALDKAEQALTNSENAVDDAQTALNTANNAEGVAIQAQNDVSNLSGTITNIGNRVTTAEGNITNLQGRMTTAEGNITNLQGRMTTAETNIGNLQTAVSTAQATANSAQQTATTARQQSYVFRYSSTALTPSSTNSNTLLDNTDNLKVGDKVIDSSGVLFSITAIDTQNSTFTIGTALIDLAQDSDVVHKSGNETVGGVKTFTDNISLKSLTAEYTVSGAGISVTYSDKNGLLLAQNKLGNYQNGISYNKFSIFAYDSNNQLIERTLTYSSANSTLATAYFRPDNDNIVSLGTTGNRWSKVYATNYYYGSNNVEFSTKFVTTDTNQTISGAKTFSDNLTIYNSDNTVTPKGLTIRNAQWGMGESGATTVSTINFLDKNSSIPASVMASKGLYGQSFLRFGVRTKDSQNNTYSEEIYFDIDTSGNVEFRSWHDNTTSLGTSSYKWKDVQTKLINGLTPSSLSLPVIDRTKYVDISGYFTNTGNGSINTYSVTANGWIYLRLTDIGGCQLSVLDSSNNRLYGSTSSGNLEQLCLPVTAGTVVETQWTTSTSVTVAIARFIPC